MKADNRGLVADLERLAGDALESAPASTISDRDAKLAAIFGSKAPASPAKPPSRPRGALFPRALRNLVGFEADDVPWRKRLPGFKEYATDIDGCEVSLMWIRPGRALPAHTHAGMELILILDGAFHDERGRFGPGDISVADATIDHRPV